MSIKECDQLQCLNCESRSFSAKKVNITRGDHSFPCAAWVCQYCYEPLMDTDQMNECLKEYKTYGRDEL